MAVEANQRFADLEGKSMHKMLARVAAEME